MSLMKFPNKMGHLMKNKLSALLLAICSIFIFQRKSFADITAPAGSYIRNQSNEQTGAKINLSSGTISTLNTNTLKFSDGTTMTTRPTPSGSQGDIQINNGGSFYGSSNLSISTYSPRSLTYWTEAQPSFGGQSSSMTITLNNNQYGVDSEISFLSDHPQTGATLQALNGSRYSKLSLYPASGGAGYNLAFENDLSGSVLFGISEEGYTNVRSSGIPAVTQDPAALGAVFGIGGVTSQPGKTLLLIYADNQDFGGGGAKYDYLKVTDSTMTVDVVGLFNSSMTLSGGYMVENSVPSPGQVLKFDGTKWKPDTDNPGDGAGGTTIWGQDDEAVVSNAVSTVTINGVLKSTVTATGKMAVFLNYDTNQFTNNASTFTALSSSFTMYGPNIPASSISAGSLGASVIASSIAVNAIEDASIVGVSSSKLSGSLPSNVLASSYTATGVTAGIYQTPTITVDAQGRISSAVTVQSTSTIGFVFENAGSVLSSGVTTSTSCVRVPFDGVISTWTAFVPPNYPSGSINVKIRKSSNLAAYTALSAGTEPILSSTNLNSDGPTGWSSTSISRNDFVCGEITSASTVTKVVIQLDAVRQ